MYEFEIILLIGCGVLVFFFLKQWYKGIFSAWPRDTIGTEKMVLGLLPVASLVIIGFTLKVLASFDVVDDPFYIFFYLLMGFAWLYLCVFCTTYFFDISWLDDALHRGNRAALWAVAGAFIGHTLIYAGANTGDGPGWWCVVFAALLGLLAFVGLGLIVNGLTGVFERITVDRDRGCAIRFACYEIAVGIIFARACGGDWTSFSATVAEFLDGWPVLVLTAGMIAVERGYRQNERLVSEPAYIGTALTGSVVWGAVYIGAAVISVLLLPLIW